MYFGWSARYACARGWAPTVHAAGVAKSSIGTRFSWQLLVSVARQYIITNSITVLSPGVWRLLEVRGCKPFRYVCAWIRNNSGLAVLVLAVSPSFVHAQESRPPRHDYPTSVRADYVIGCLAANGFQHRLLAQCACSIDAIADQMSYEDYDRAETILSMQQAAVGPRGGLFRDTPVAKQSLQQIQRAQAEANLRCGQ